MHEINIRKDKGVSLTRCYGVITMDDRLAIMTALARRELVHDCPRTIIDLSAIDDASDTWEEIEFGRNIGQHLSAFHGRHTAVILNPGFMVSSTVCWNLQKFGMKIMDCFSENEAHYWLGRQAA